MTCQAAVMNNLAIAVASDTAVSMTGKRKIFHGAQKLFPLAPFIPIAIMISGSSELLSLPWEVIIKTYARQLNGRTFDTLTECANDFFSFIEQSHLFSADDQREGVKNYIGTVWSDLFQEAQNSHHQDHASTSGKLSFGLPESGRDITDTFADIVRKANRMWIDCPDLNHLGSDFGCRILDLYALEIDQLEHAFDRLKPSPKLKQELRSTIPLMFGKEWFHPHFETVIAFLGMGDAEPLPAILEYHVGTMAAGRLRFAKTNEMRVTGRHDAWVVPFGERDTVEMVVSGIHPRLRQQLVTTLDDWLPDDITNKDGLRKAFDSYIEKRITQPYLRPFFSGISGLPQGELAKLAEELVTITALMKRVRTTQIETVGGYIDVAILSKGDGFVWVKHHCLHEAAKVAVAA